MVSCWERADLLALVCDVKLGRCHLPIGILNQVWCLIVSIPDLCPLSYVAGYGFGLARDLNDRCCLKVYFTDVNKKGVLKYKTNNETVQTTQTDK